jgi:hypothetical protein
MNEGASGTGRVDVQPRYSTNLFAAPR